MIFAFLSTAFANESASILQGSIHLIPSDPTGKIYPENDLKLAATIENVGTKASPSGTAYLRFALIAPLENQKDSVLFETEKKPFSSILPQQKIEIAFDAMQKIPSILDYVRNDWFLREYQLIVGIEGKEMVIATLAFTFSAYYYPTLKKSFSTLIP